MVFSRDLRKTRIGALSISGFLFFSIANVILAPPPKTTFSPTSIDTVVLQGGWRTFDVSVISTKTVLGVDFWVVPELQSYVKIVPNHFDKLNAGEAEKVTIEISVPKTLNMGQYEGVLHVRVAKKNLANPLPISFDVESPTQLEDKISEVMLNTFGTLTPPIPDGQRFLVVEVPQDIVDLASAIADEPIVFKKGSIIYAQLLKTKQGLDGAILDLLNDLHKEGININDLFSSNTRNIWNVDMDENVIPIGADAITFPPPLIAYDQNADDEIDTYVFTFDKRTHIVLSPQHADILIGRNFRDSSSDNAFSDSAITATHELLHAFDFRSQCGGRGWDQSDLEEAYMFRIEDLLKVISRDNPLSNLINGIAEAILTSWPNTENCLALLNLTRPHPSTLNANSANNSITLFWTANSDNDFKSYKLYRATHADVTLNDALVSEITDQNTNQFTDTNVVSGQRYYYKLFTFDKPGLSVESNEVSATVASACPQGTYTAQYFSDTSANNPFPGQPIIQRCEDAPLNKDWGLNSPDPAISSENFSARWTGTFNFPQDNTYIFQAITDDGMKVYIDNNLVIDAWFDQSRRSHWVSLPVTAGTHTVKVEYYEHFINAVAMLDWYIAPPSPQLPSLPCPQNTWTAEYFTDATSQDPFLGNPDLITCEPFPLNNDWGQGSPNNISSDYFTARYTGTFSFDQDTTHLFQGIVDDGMRIFIDNIEVYNAWGLHNRLHFEFLSTINTGTHTVRVEYFEQTGNAAAILNWEPYITLTSLNTANTQISCSGFTCISAWGFKEEGE